MWWRSGGQDGDAVCIIVSGADRGAFGEMQHQATVHVMRRLWHVQSDDLGAGVQIAMLSNRSLPIRQWAD